MASTVKNQMSLLHATQSRIDTLKALSEALKCQSLSDYLDSKRSAFLDSFISDDELLSVLGSSDPEFRFTAKTFDNCKRLTFGRGNKIVQG